MKSYLFIGSESGLNGSGPDFFPLACDLAKRGDKVEILLVQNAVAAARAGAKSAGLETALRAGIMVYADDFSMRERGLPVGALTRGVKPCDLDSVIERAAAGWNIVWH